MRFQLAILLVCCNVAGCKFSFLPECHYSLFC